MANDVVSMINIFPACREILDNALRPIKYTDLVTQALEQLGIPLDYVNFQRQIEDVREKMLIKGMYDSFYIGKPHCYAALNSWFSNGQIDLFNWHKPIVIPGDVSSGVHGAYEAIKRSPTMKKKNPYANIDLVHWARAYGLVIEQHVADWFKTNWPDSVLRPDNYQKWNQWCDHDFKIRIDHRVFNVDVFGPKRDGSYGQPPQKKQTHFHLMCRAIGKDVLWEGIITGAQYRDTPDIVPEIGRPPQHMIVRLNCEKFGIPYDVVKAAAR